MASLNEGFCPYSGKPCSAVHSAEPRPFDLFFAYASKPQRRVDAIQAAIEMVRDDTRMGLSVVDWQDLTIEGTIIWCALCEAIRNSGTLVADISDLNFNVLFELGFAVGCGRTIWPIIEETELQSRTYSSFKTLTTIGHSKYKNSRSIFTKISRRKQWTKKPYLSALAPLSGAPTRKAHQILYLKSTSENEPSLRITEFVEQLPLDITVDDPSEISFQPLSWYLGKLSSSCAVLIDLGHEDADGARLHMAKCALVAGASLASGRRVLMLGEDLSFWPIDYHDLLQNYKNAAMAASLASTFLAPLKSQIQSLKEHMRSDLLPVSLSEVPIVERIDLGDSVAEQERPALADYFVETPIFEDSLQGGFKLVVGRKGTGKSALSYMVAERLREDARKMVRLISPRGYELDQILAISQRFETPTRSRFLESLWKYMIATEALDEIAQRVESKTIGSALSSSEKAVKNYVEAHPDITQLSFPSRLGRLLERQHLIPSAHELVPETAVVAALHKNELRTLRDLIASYLTEQRCRLTILIDGLLGPWHATEERDLLAEVLLSLVYAVQQLWKEWTYKLGEDAQAKSLSIITFFRTDVFRTLLDRAEEPDKLQYEQLYWDDAEALLQVIARRIKTSVFDGQPQDLNWGDLLGPDFSYDDLRKLLERSILNRPRDVIYYFQRVLFHARRRKNPRLTRKDFDNALTGYSEYALQALSAEWHPYIPDMSDLLLGFWGGRRDLSYQQLSATIMSNGVATDNVAEAIRFLIQSQFLGLAIDESNFKYALSPMESTIMERQMGRFVHQRHGERKFRIHRAFQRSLALTN